MFTFSSFFFIPLGIALGISIVELILLLVGASSFISLDTNSPFDGDIDFDLFGDFAAWSGIGTIPLTIFIGLFTLFFGTFGLASEIIATAILGVVLSPMVSIPLALIPTFFIVSAIAKVLRRLMPTEKDTLESISELVGYTAIIITGTARYHVAAEAKVDNKYGTHYVYVRSSSENQTITQGTEVILTEFNTEGGFFRALPQNITTKE